jgi:hypothetical protein
VEVHLQRHLGMSIRTTHSTAITTPPILEGIDLHYETENRLMWNERERRNEERELVYEISWIPELNTWRRFLRAQRSK